jgi:hypothetical protein
LRRWLEATSRKRIKPAVRKEKRGTGVRRSEDSKTFTTGSELLQHVVPQTYKAGSLRTPPRVEEVDKDAHGCDETSQKTKNNFVQLKNTDHSYS